MIVSRKAILNLKKNVAMRHTDQYWYCLHWYVGNIQLPHRSKGNLLGGVELFHAERGDVDVLSATCSDASVSMLLLGSCLVDL